VRLRTDWGGVGEGLATGAAVVCPAVARCIGVVVRWLLVEEEGGAGVELVWNMMLGALGFQHTTERGSPTRTVTVPPKAAALTGCADANVYICH
jgi:hypothetical protein